MATDIITTIDSDRVHRPARGLLLANEVESLPETSIGLFEQGHAAILHILPE